ncbi:mannitol-1-phosphate 5-dehydrogenase [Paenibacillus sp. LMG 31456]|uniref:Mannitol-1-phosphate 5-dehydrogenase n=1 Tax=Paenibacillus foliorum TaxID=2654974 RepID=A0A972GTB5_9BACL|nr:mannitol-1-phosphate 5-dehydrogenase [Paenibacillus foliorum]NOU94049.1 mannitol-1-phosphate 5-dehydrogenase [Paenibacillus foliorum]
MKAVHIGAGNIGRGFIGLLLSQAGYEVCFVDVNEPLVKLLQQKGAYTVSLANSFHDTTLVSGVSAINGKDLEQVAEAIASSELVTTAVGLALLDTVSIGIAKGIEKRMSRSSAPLQIIACENTIDGSSQLKDYVYTHLSQDIRNKANQLVSFPNAAVDRIVPIQHHEDPLMVIVEPFYEWLVDRSGLLPGVAEIAGVHYVDQLEPYIQRKLFTVNTGHSCIAYLGYLSGHDTILESMENPAISLQVQHILEETGSILIRSHGFNPEEHSQYIRKILDRFRNPYLSDEVVRVARSPIRKLSPNDRLVYPALQGFDLGIEPKYLALAMAAALLFDYQEDAEAVELQEAIKSRGIHQVAAQITGIPEGHPIHALIIQKYLSLRT